MTIIPEVLSIAAEMTFKFQVTPLNIFMLIGLGLCVALVWRYARKKMG
jgi:hypothetical protein